MRFAHGLLRQFERIARSRDAAEAPRGAYSISNTNSEEPAAAPVGIRRMEDAVTLLEIPETPLPQRDLAMASQARVVVIRLMDGQTLHVGSAPNRESAVTFAKSVIADYERTGEWPHVGNRLIRPDAIVSVDVVRLR